jgi:hypothetical protein
VAKDSVGGERRAQRRYVIELDLEYRIIEHGTVVAAGWGKTGNMSSQGLLFHCADSVEKGPAVELTVRWPPLGGEEHFVALCIFGRILRSDSQGIAVRVSRYCFQKLDALKTEYAELSGAALVQ